ncbi:hypothetical protein [Allocoleopsis sp.]|uniref:hypothetical protein n=1 Tax=Allocoleopsis sp. TaxID=3088169 RepID=UPI002FD7678A
MNKFIGLMIRVVVVTALVGTVTGCNRVPFLGRNQSANQAGDSPEATQNQGGTRTQVQRASQPARQAQNSTQTNSQSPDDNLNPEATNTGTGQSGSNQGLPALW